MGMAASQARLLNLTAKKSNQEFEGQQINQQRTTLSNQSASYNNQLLSLGVPTPPSTLDYAKTQYSITMNGSSCEITHLTKELGTDPVTYTVGYTTPTTNTMMTASDKYNVTGAGGAYKIGTVDLVAVPVDSTAYNLLQNLFGTTDTGSYFSYTSDDGSNTYFEKTEIDTAVAAGNSTQGYAAQEFESEEMSYLTNATVTFSGDQPTSISVNGTSIKVNTKSNLDGDAYNDAMSQYEYEKSQYEKQMNDINSKLAIIQQQDKQLELKLKQIDTDHNATQTEMDAVKKVIDKNVEGSFKTFSG